MSNLSSIHFKKSTRFQVYHNDKIRPSYAIGGEVECNKSSEEARILCDEMIAKAKQRYYETSKARNKNFQSTNYLQSAVVNIKESTTMDDLEKLAKKLNEEYGFQCYQISIHRDEGHINDNGEKVINHHAHMEFVTLDKETGKSCFRLNKADLRNIQDITAQELGMERGKDKRETGAKRIEPRAYAQMKEQEKANTRELKQDLEQEKAENKALKQDLASQKAVNTAFEEIRQLMIADGISTADDYRALAKKKKEAQAQQKAGLTKEQLDKLIADATKEIQAKYDDQIKKKDEKIEKLEKAKIDEYIKSNEMEKSNKELLDSYLASADTLENARTQIEIISVARNFDDIALSQAKNTIINLKEELKNKAPKIENNDDEMKEQIKTLEKENQSLKAENQALKKTIDKLSTLKDYIETYFHDVVNKYLSFMKNTNKLDKAIEIETKAQQLTPKKDEPKAKNRGFSRC